MAANIYIYCPEDGDGLGRCDLEDKLAGFFDGVAEECGAGSGIGGFNLHFEMAAGVDPHALADHLKVFLAAAGVKAGTMFDVFPNGWQPDDEWRRVNVFGSDLRRTDRPGSA